MAKTVKPIKDFISERINSRQETLNTLAAQPIDDNDLPDLVKQSREQERKELRARLTELKDVLATINALYPDSNA